MNSKELFLNYCKIFSKELADLQKSFDEDLDLWCSELGTLADLGLNWSFELANIGFELGYASWCFTTKATSFTTIKEYFFNMIMENETLENVYSNEELKRIGERIKKAS